MFQERIFQFNFLNVVIDHFICLRRKCQILDIDFKQILWGNKNCASVFFFIVFTHMNLQKFTHMESTHKGLKMPAREPSCTTRFDS